MYPVTGPFYDIRSVKYPGSTTVQYDCWRRWSKQAAPHTLRLGYTCRRGNSWTISAPADRFMSPYTAISATEDGVAGNMANQAKSRAWARFVDSCTTVTFEAGESFFQHREARLMLLRRVTQLSRFARLLNRGNLYGAWRELGLPQSNFDGFQRKVRLNGVPLKWAKLHDPRRKYVKVSPPRDKYPLFRALSDLWLEFHFGWSPLVSDTYSAIELLSTKSPLPSTARGRGRVGPTITTYKAGSYSANKRLTYSVKAQYLADIEVANPNVAMWAQAGLINPASVALALVPWSFILDWFTNLSQVVSGYSSLWGLNVTNSATTVKTDVHHVEQWNNYGWLFAANAYNMQRTTGLGKPSFTLKPFNGFSLTRGATAVSLLVGLLPKK